MKAFRAPRCSSLENHCSRRPHKHDAGNFRCPFLHSGLCRRTEQGIRMCSRHCNRPSFFGQKSHCETTSGRGTEILKRQLLARIHTDGSVDIRTSSQWAKFVGFATTRVEQLGKEFQTILIPKRNVFSAMEKTLQIGKFEKSCSC